MLITLTALLSLAGCTCKPDVNPPKKTVEPTRSQPAADEEEASDDDEGAEEEGDEAEEASDDDEGAEEEDDEYGD